MHNPGFGIENRDFPEYLGFSRVSVLECILYNNKAYIGPIAVKILGLSGFLHYRNGFTIYNM